MQLLKKPFLFFKEDKISLRRTLLEYAVIVAMFFISRATRSLE